MCKCVCVECMQVLFLHSFTPMQSAKCCFLNVFPDRTACAECPDHEIKLCALLLSNDESWVGPNLEKWAPWLPVFRCGKPRDSCSLIWKACHSVLWLVPFLCFSVLSDASGMVWNLGKFVSRKWARVGQTVPVLNSLHTAPSFLTLATGIGVPGVSLRSLILLE